MARKKLTACDAKRLLRSEGIRFGADVDTLRYSDLNRVAEVAKAAGYRKSKGAPGSTGRMYFQYLARIKGCDASLGRARRARKRSR